MWCLREVKKEEGERVWEATAAEPKRRWLEDVEKERHEGVSREDSSFNNTSTPRPRAAAITDVAFPASIPTAELIVDIKCGWRKGRGRRMTIFQHSEGERGEERRVLVERREKKRRFSASVQKCLELLRVYINTMVMNLWSGAIVVGERLVQQV